MVPPIQEQQKLVDDDRNLKSEAGVYWQLPLTQLNVRSFSANIAPALSQTWLPGSSTCGRRPPGYRTGSRRRSLLEETDALTDTDNREAAPEEAAV